MELNVVGNQKDKPEDETSPVTGKDSSAVDPTTKSSMDVDSTNDPTDAITEAQPADEPLSKSQQKKINRQKRMEETRAEWKAQKREKDKARKRKKKEEKRAAALVQGTTVDELVGQKRKADGDESEGDSAAAKRPKIDSNSATKRVLAPITLILDCGFDELMTEKEVVSLSSQITRCYSSNRRSKHHVSLQVTSFNGRLRARAESTLKNQHMQWKGITFSELPYEVTEKDKTNDGDLIYLTADSEHTIETLEPGKKYIIGGIVDRNRHKNICYKKAIDQGIKTARLPIGDYIKMSSRHVLTTNQVIEIMLKYLETRDWERAFMSEIPQRKMPQIATSTEESQDECNAGETVQLSIIELASTKDIAEQDVVMGDDYSSHTKAQGMADEKNVNAASPAFSAPETGPGQPLDTMK